MAGLACCALRYCSCLLLLYYGALICSAEEGSWSIRPAHIPGLVCHSLGFHYMLYPKWNGPISVKLTAFDQQGGAHALSGRRDCGTWMTRRPNGSVALHAFYNGCYVYEENDENVMSILVEKESNPGNWTFTQLKTLKCPKLRVTVQCSRDELVSVAISKSFTRPPRELYSVPLIIGEEACKPVLKSNGITLFQFSLSTCGTTSKEADGVVIYETVVLANTDLLRPNDTSIKTSLPIQLHIQCRLASSDISTENTDAVIPSPSPSDVAEPLMRFAEVQMAIYKAAANTTVLVSSQGPLYFPTAEETEASGKGSPLLAEEWERIVLVVGILAALLSICIIRRRCQKLSDEDMHSVKQ